MYGHNHGFATVTKPIKDKATVNDIVKTDGARNLSSMTDSLHGATMGDKIPGGSQRKRFLNEEKISFMSLEEEGPDLR